MEIGDGLTPGERAEPRQAPRAFDDEPRAGGEEYERAGEAADEDGPHLEGARLPDGEGAQACDDGNRSQPWTATGEARLDVLSQDERGGHPPDIEQGPEREEESQSRAHGESGENGARREPGVEGHGHEGRESRSERPLGRAAEGGPEQAASQAQEHRLEEIGREHLAPVRAEALEDGDGLELAAHEGAHAGGHADAPHHERDEAGEPEVHRELVPEATHAGLGLGVGRHAHARIGQARGERVLERLGARAGGQAEEESVAHAAALADEVSAVEITRVDEHARPEREDADGAVGLLADDAAHGKVAFADLEMIAYPEAEAGQEGLVNERAAPADQGVDRSRRRSDEVAVEWVAVSNRLELDDLALPPRRRHGHELSDRHRIRPRTGEGGHDATSLVGERLGAPDLDVPAHEGPCRAPHRALEAGREAAHGDQCADPEGDAGDQVGEVPPGAAHLPPGEQGHEAPTRPRRHCSARRWPRGRRGG